MTRPQDVFGAAPKSVLNKPFMHVQDQKPTGTNGGTSVSGDNPRDLNTVLTNEIQGASLNPTIGEVTLPAGEYYVEGVAIAGSTPKVVTVNVDGVMVLKSPNHTAYGITTTVSACGKINLSSTSILGVHSYVGTGESSTGLGFATSTGSYEAYTDLKIWKLDSQIRTPVVNNGGIYPVPANTYVTGNMFGLDYAKTGDHTIQVQPGVCFDALNSTLLTGALQTVTIPSAINTIYNLFLCNDGLVRTDTDVDGVNLSGTYQIRWIGFVLNDASGVIIGFIFDGAEISFDTAATFGTLTTTFTQYDIGVVCPLSRCTNHFVSRNALMYTSMDGVVIEQQGGATSTPFCRYVDGWFLKRNTTVGSAVYLAMTTLKR